MLPFRRTAALLLPGLLAACIAMPGHQALPADPIPLSHDYVLKIWEMDDGLPANNISAITQTPDGYLWIATTAGLARFDGVQFTTFFARTSPGLLSDVLFSAMATPEGDLWLGLERGGVVRMRDGHFEAIVPMVPAGTSTPTTGSMARDAAGGIWFAYYRNLELTRWKNGQLVTFSPAEGVGPGSSSFVYATTAGAIWFSSTKACGIFDGKRFRPFAFGSGDEVRLAPARDGGMWIVRDLKLLHIHPDGTQETVADISWLGRGTQINTLFADHEGNLWIGTRGMGLIRYHDGAFTRVPTSQAEIMTIAEDREGNIWAGTRGGGLNRLRRNFFSLKQTQDGLSNDNIYALCEDATQRLWVIGRDNSLAHAVDPANKAFSPAPNEAFSNGINPMTICRDPDGGLWLGTLHGILHLEKDVFTREPMTEAATALLVDRWKYLWVSTIQGGLIRYRDGIAEPIPTDHGLIHPRALAEDRAGRLWVGTEEGRVFRQTGSPSPPKSGEFVPIPLPGAKEELVAFIVPDENGDVWIGMKQSGLYRWRNGAVARFADIADLYPANLQAMAIGPEGDLWLGTAKGLLRIARSGIEATLKTPSQPLPITIYGRDDGLPNLEFAYGFRGSPVRTHDGHLWFATYRGALEITPHPQRQVAPKSSILIEQIQVGDSLLPPESRQGFTLAPQPGPVEIRYTLPLLTTPERLRFRYRLVGLSDIWISARGQRAATFPSLPPGTYRFEVAATEDGATWQPTTTSVTFTVQAAWWQTTLFQTAALALAACALAALVRAIVRRRMHARMRAREQKYAVLRERARIAQDMHDDLGASLTQIALFSGLAESESGSASPSGKFSARAAACARQAVTALDEIVWAVNPRNDTLPCLLEYLGQHAADYLHGAGVRCVLDLPPEPPPLSIPADFRHHLFLIVKEALHNTIKHASPQEVRLKVDIQDAALDLEIEDDGQGFAPGDGYAGADGLLNIHARVTALAGTCRIESRIGHGTMLKFLLPLPRQPSNPRSVAPR